METDQQRIDILLEAGFGESEAKNHLVDAKIWTLNELKEIRSKLMGKLDESFTDDSMARRDTISKPGDSKIIAMILVVDRAIRNLEAGSVNWNVEPEKAIEGLSEPTKNIILEFWKRFSSGRPIPKDQFESHIEEILEGYLDEVRLIISREESVYENIPTDLFTVEKASQYGKILSHRRNHDLIMADLKSDKLKDFKLDSLFFYGKVDDIL